MIYMTKKKRKVLNKLLEFANGDSKLVMDAMRNCSKRDYKESANVVDAEKMIQYIVDNRNGI